MYDDIHPPQHCPICDVTFAPAEPTDAHRHRTLHGRIRRLVRRLGYIPAGYAERERMKDEGDRLRREAQLLVDRAAGAEMVLRANYDRHLRNLLGSERPGKVLSFAQHLIAEPLEALFGLEVARFLRRKYGACV